MDEKIPYIEAYKMKDHTKDGLSLIINGFIVENRNRIQNQSLIIEIFHTSYEITTDDSGKFELPIFLSTPEHEDVINNIDTISKKIETHANVFEKNFHLQKNIEKDLALPDTNTQTFEILREDNQTYVDKTDILYNLISKQKTLFVTRPRRFGRSLLG